MRSHVAALDPSAATGQALMGLNQAKCKTTEALQKAANLQLPSQFEPYQVRDKV